jgi:hypothetical protein
MNSQSNNRYNLRQEPNGLWTVYDIFTGEPAEVNGIPQNGLDMEIADDLVDLLNCQRNGSG